MAIKKKQLNIQTEKLGYREKHSSKNVFEGAINYLKLQEEKIIKNPKKQLIFFLLGFLIFYLILSGAVYLFPKGFFENITGESVNAVLNFGGIKTTTSAGEEFNIYLLGANSVANNTIIISWLCSGVLEIIILICAILASFGVSWRKKVIGIIWAVIIGYFFNLLRIIITIIILLTQATQVLELAHDVLFKLTLFIFITIFYVVWFTWANK